MLKSKKSISAKTALNIIVSFAIAFSPLYQPKPALGGTASTTVAPNLMVILGNSYSMNRMMDNINLPNTPSGLPIQNQCTASYGSNAKYYPAPVFANDPGCGGSGTPFPDHLYGNQPDSKVYIAKSVLYQLMQSTQSNNINFGFATFRQAFGMQNSVSTVLTNTFWPNIFPSGGTFSDPLPGDLSGYTTVQLNTYGTDPNHFSWISWWPAWDNTKGASFSIGLNKQGGTPQADNNRVAPFASSTSGLPLSVQYPQGQQSPFYENNNPLYGDYFYGSGGLDMGPPINSIPGSVDPNFTLCKTYYDSQANAWQGEYIASNPDGSPRMVINTYPGTYNGSTIQFIPIGSTQYNSDGSMNPQQWTDLCSVTPYNRTIRQQSEMISDQFKTSSGTGGLLSSFSGPLRGSSPDSSPAYFNFIPSIYDTTSSAGVGAFTGWSGAATYNRENNTYTASYPAGAQSSEGVGSYNRSGAKTMGAFIDLPSPSAGYVDQRKLIENLVNPDYPQWDDSGLGYDQNTQTIVNDGVQQSISASDFKPDYDPHQEPVYDSLMDAAAYYSAYKKQDEFDGCRTNAVLLIYDGHEDANYTRDSQGNITYADPARAAAALLAIGVKTNVVIISSNPGDISQANAIAAAGGTEKAFQVKNASDLLNAVSAVFTGLQGAVMSASPATPGQVTSGSMAYAAVSNNNYGAMEGHLFAYPIAANGTIGTSPVFDAASPNLQASRGSKLWSDTQDSSTGLQKFTAWSSLPPAVFQATASPDAETISAYTVDPNYGGGIYLAGRKPDSIVGTITAKSSSPVISAPPSNPLLLNTPGYAAYAQSSASRPTFVLWSADDGFLYSADAKTGALNWAYMPSPLLPQLKNYSTFESSQPMNGGFGVYDGIGADNAWHSFVFGAAQSGATHYVFQLDKNGNPVGTVPVMIDNQVGSTSSDLSAPTVVWDGNGVAYAIYTTIQGTSATINVMSSKGVISHAALKFVPSSPIAVNRSTGDLYFGAVGGNIYTLNTRSGFTASDIAGTYKQSSSLVGTLPNHNDPAQYVGFSQTSSGLFVWATGSKQIAAFSIGATGWQTIWTTQDGGPSYNIVNGTTTSYASDPGVTGSGPQFLPATATITDKSVVLNGALIVPVTTLPAGSTAECTASGAFYYLFQLSNGVFPMDQFKTSDGKFLVHNIALGVGIAFSPVVSYNASAGNFSIYGSAQQNTNLQATFDLVAQTKSHIGSGIIGLRPFMMTQP